MISLQVIPTIKCQDYEPVDGGILSYVVFQNYEEQKLGRLK